MTNISEIEQLKLQIEKLQNKIKDKEKELEELDCYKVELIENQIKVAQLILQKVREKLDPYAIIAGGAPRDWYMGKPAHDIDIYLYLPNNYYKKQQNIDNCKHIINKVSFDLIYNKVLSRDESIVIEEYGGFLPDSIIDVVLEYCYSMCTMNWNYIENSKLKYINIPIQFIFTKTDEDRWKTLESFQVSLSEVYFDGSAIRATDNFMKSLKTKTIKFGNTRYTQNHKYYKKMLERFGKTFKLEITNYKYSGYCDIIKNIINIKHSEDF